MAEANVRIAARPVFLLGLRAPPREVRLVSVCLALAVDLPAVVLPIIHRISESKESVKERLGELCLS